MALDTSQAKLAHLLRRAAFAATPALIGRYQDAALPDVVDDLLKGGDSAEPLGPEANLPSLENKPLDLNTLGGAQLWWLNRMVTTQNPLRERMTLFWHGHFATAVTKVRPTELMVEQNTTLRRRALGRFHDLLADISVDSAMLQWLDGSTSRKGAPNENYAREVMELFCLGIGHYTEDDVKAGARAYTGYTVKDGVVTYNDNRHDHGSKNYLSHTGDLGYDQMTDILASDPDTANFLATRLWSAFVYPNPTPADVAPIARAYQDSNGDISAMLRTIFTSDTFYSPQAVGSMVRTPVELVVGTCRMLGLSPVTYTVLSLLHLMGQDLFNPPNVAGWPPGMAWLSAGTLAARMNFGRWVAGQVVKDDLAAMNIGEMLDELTGSAADGLLGYWSKRLDLAGRLTPTTQAALADFQQPPATIGQLVHQSATLVQALMSSPEAQYL